MKNPTARAKALTALLKSLDTSEWTQPDAGDPIAVLVFSFLLWETSLDRATTAYEKLTQAVVDFNDLRICMPHESVAFIGSNYPRALDRCQRMRASLRDIYLREHAVSLERVQAMGKRDVRKYIETLAGMTPFVAERVLLLAFDAHGVPVDEQLRTQLIDEDVLEEGIEVPEAVSWLSRQIKSVDSRGTHFGLQRWIDDQAASSRTKKPSRKKLSKTSAARKSSGSTTRKKSAGKSGGTSGGKSSGGTKKNSKASGS